MVLIVSRFGFEGWIKVPVVSVPDLRILLLFSEATKTFILIAQVPGQFLLVAFIRNHTFKVNNVKASVVLPQNGYC